MNISEAAQISTRVVRVLLVEDNAADVGLVRVMLDAEQFELEVTHRVESAVVQLTTGKFDVILLDLTLPDSDGLQSFEAIRAAGPQIPIIVLTGLDDEDLAEDSVKGGAQDYLIKGQIDSKLLTRSIRYGIERKRILSENERIRHEAENAHREAVTLNEVARQLAAELNIDALIQKVTDAGTALTSAKFGAFFYNVDGEAYLLYTLSGAPRSAFDKLGLPRNTAIFAPTFRGEHVVRLNDVTEDPRYGLSSPHYGMPPGHLPVRSYLAVPVISRSGEVIGGLFFGHPQPNVFTEDAERIALGIAAQAAIAIDNARLYSDLKKSEAALKDADRRKDEFLATLAHELRNPLAPIRNAIQILKFTGNTNGNADKPLSIMERQTQHMVRLIDDLLDVSRISLGKIELRTDEIDLRTVLTHALEASQPIVDNFGHDLIIEIPDQEITVNGDLVRLAQVFENLLNNAAKYTNKGGHIRLKATVDEQSVRVSVKDNGVGIDPTMLNKVFEIFMQLEASETRSHGGLGIGLSITKNLVEMHGGTISAKSAGIGQGSEFTVALPLALRPAIDKHGCAEKRSDPHRPVQGSRRR